jgi:hypothetical protein
MNFLFAAVVCFATIATLEACHWCKWEGKHLCDCSDGEVCQGISNYCPTCNFCIKQDLLPPPPPTVKPRLGSRSCTKPQTQYGDNYDYNFNPDQTIYPDGSGLTISCGRKGLPPEDQTLIPLGFLSDGTKNYASLWGDFTINCKDGEWYPQAGTPSTAYLPVFKGNQDELRLKTTSCKIDLGLLFKMRK